MPWILCLSGGIVFVVGLTVFAGLTIALGDVGADVDQSALQTLHVLNQEMFFTVTIGAAGFLLGAGAAVSRSPCRANARKSSAGGSLLHPAGVTRAGSCQCGHVRYEVSGPDIGLVLCYCTECQRLSTGIGTYSMVFPRGAFRLISGSLKSHERAGHAGTRNVGHFCPKCGVRIYHEDPHQDYVRLKAGTLNHASELEPDAHIWTQSAPAWVRLPDGCLSYETQAEPAEMIAAVQARRAARADRMQPTTDSEGDRQPPKPLERHSRTLAHQAILHLDRARLDEGERQADDHAVCATTFRAAP